MPTLSIDEISKLSLKQTVLINTTSKKSDGTFIYDSGAGFVLQGEYLVSCHHTVNPKEGETLEAVTIYYNSQNANGETLLNKEEIDLAYIYTNEQFDFSKHFCNDLMTDVTVLKLKNKIIVDQPKFCATKVVQNSKLYATGISITGNEFASKTSEFIYLAPMDPPWRASNMITEYLTMFGAGGHGFSGSPVFNIEGEVVGIIQSGFDDPTQLLDDWLSQGIIKQIVYNNFLQGYRDGKQIQSAINIQFVLDTYLKGYIGNS